MELRKNNKPYTTTLEYLESREEYRKLDPMTPEYKWSQEKNRKLDSVTFEYPQSQRENILDESLV